MNRIITNSQIVLAFLLSTFSFCADVKAATYYLKTDKFDASPTDWSPWSTSNGTAILGVNDSNARSANNDFVMALNGGTSSDFVLIDKVFSVWTFAQGGPPPGVTPSMCTVWAYVRPLHNVTGALQLINANTWTYIGSQSFSLSTSTSYTLVRLDVVGPQCAADMDVRIGLSGNGGSQLIWVDDVTITWVY